MKEVAHREVFGYERDDGLYCKDRDATMMMFTLMSFVWLLYY